MTIRTLIPRWDRRRTLRIAGVAVDRACCRCRSFAQQAAVARRCRPAPPWRCPFEGPGWQDKVLHARGLRDAAARAGRRRARAARDEHHARQPEPGQEVVPRRDRRRPGADDDLRRSRSTSWAACSSTTRPTACASVTLRNTTGIQIISAADGIAEDARDARRRARHQRAVDARRHRHRLHDARPTTRRTSGSPTSRRTSRARSRRRRCCTTFVTNFEFVNNGKTDRRRVPARRPDAAAAAAGRARRPGDPPRR